MRFNGGPVLVVDDESLDDYFSDITGDNSDDLFPDGDDDKNIPEDEKPDDWPWEILKPNSRRRRLQGDSAVPSSSALPTSSYISNPVVCKTLGSAILWEQLTTNKYPVYLKDSLLNTNDDFDFGEFDKLPDQLAAGNAEAFVFTFTQPGIYVFGDSRNLSKQMIIAIMDEDQSCPDDTAFSPKTYSSLLKVGAFMRDVLEPPNWPMFFGVLLAGCFLILLTVLIISYIVKRDWRQKYLPKIYYQEQNYGSVERSDPEDKKAIVSINTEAESFTFRHMGREDDDDEELNMRMDNNAKRLGVKKKAKKKKKDLQLPHVEDLKDRLQKHLIEI